MTLFIELTIWFVYFTVGAFIFSLILPVVLNIYINGFYCKRYYCGVIGGFFSLLYFHVFEISDKFTIAFIMTFILSAVASVDYFTMKIPDMLIFFMILCSIPAAFVFSDISMQSRLIGLFQISIPAFIVSIFVKDSFGGSDIKFLAACGFFLGWEYNIRAVIIALLAGGIFAACALIRGRVGRKDNIAFGPFLCLSAVLVILNILK